MLKILSGDCLVKLQELGDETVDCCVTSPPYWGLRQYLFDKAQVLRYDLTNEEKTFIEAELAKRGIKPRQ
jgi:DNA modification methylase